MRSLLKAIDDKDTLGYLEMVRRGWFDSIHTAKAGDIRFYKGQAYYIREAWPFVVEKVDVRIGTR